MHNDRSAEGKRLRRMVASNPGDRVSWHNLAALEGDLGRVDESEAAARRAIALGITAPETRLVLARALQAQRRLDEAERMFEEALALRPVYVEAHRDLAQLVWMRTGEVALALRPLDAALRAAPHEPGLHLVRSIVLEFAGDLSAALAAAQAGVALAPDDSQLLRQAAHLCAVTRDPDLAVTLAQRAAKAAPPGPEVWISLCEALLAAGRHREAEATAASVVAAAPDNQHALALQATAWRLLGDARYPELYDYATLLESRPLEAPQGWTSLASFLEEAAAELDGLHAFKAHPLQQSVRGGGQLSLQRAELARPLIGALFQSIDAAVQRHVSRLGSGPGPLRSRNTGKFAISGAWSVRLRSGGYHSDHVHPRGWISSACYIALPPGIGGGEGERPDRSGCAWAGPASSRFPRCPPSIS
jgi:tetratricopeptide (TPR) repeat protein